MWWAVLGSSVIGVAIAAVALRFAPRRFRAPRLAAGAGPVGALLGGIITRWVVGPGDPVPPLLAALVVAVAAMSLLLRPPTPIRRRGPRPA